jgi:hypothetical protein
MPGPFHSEHLNRLTAPDRSSEADAAGLVYLRCQDCRELVGCPGDLLGGVDGRPKMTLLVDLRPMVEHTAADLSKHPSFTIED